jgi:hypothetical protein
MPVDLEPEVLAFVAEHPIVVREQVETHLRTVRIATDASLCEMAEAGLLSSARASVQGPVLYRITRRGLARIGSELAPPSVDPRCHRHDLAVVWLWLAARAGRLGEVRAVFGGRAMRQHDDGLLAGGMPDPLAGRADAMAFGIPSPVRPESTGLLYPDVMLDVGVGRIPVTLATSPLEPGALEAAVIGWGRDVSVAAVLYLVTDTTVTDLVQTTAERLGLSALVQVQPAGLGG